MRHLSRGSTIALLLALPLLATRPASAEPSIPMVSVPLTLHAHAPTRAPATSPRGFVGSAEGLQSLDDPRWSADPEPAAQAPSPTSLTMPVLHAARRSGPALHPALTPPLPVERYGIGRTWRLGHGRELVVDLTPSPRHCAPLLALTF